MFCELKSNPHNGNLQKEYKNYRNKLTTLITDAKNTHHNQKIITHSSDPKITYEIVNEICTHTGKIFELAISYFIIVDKTAVSRKVTPFYKTS